MFVQLWDTDMKNHKIEQCPCGQQQTYAQCCAPYHQGTAIAPTAELLMRSRYSAYVLAIKEYLLSTWHESTRPKKLTFIPLMKYKLLYNGNNRKEMISEQTIQARDRRKCRGFEEDVQTRKASENKRKGADVISI